MASAAGVAAADGVGTSIRASRLRAAVEGNALVVETTNFLSGIPVGNTPATDALRITERFTLADADTLSYQLTVDDPKTWTKSWTVAFPLKRSKDYQVFEYACHEGNYYMHNALSGARAEEKKK